MKKKRIVKLEPQTVELFAEVLSKLRPPPPLTVSQWADRYRVLSAESSAEPGRWHTEKAPYQRAIMDAIGDPHVRSVVVMSAAQIGKTDAFILNPLGYYMDYALDTRDREGFSKSTFRLYGEGIRLTARQILLDAHAANNVNFQTDYDKRVEKIGAVVDGCSLLLEYLTICTEEGIISAKKAGIWTKKVTDVKYPAMKWLTSERGRAEKLRAEAERKRLTEQAAALKAVLYPEP